jgi:hypothetical protein
MSKKPVFPPSAVTIRFAETIRRVPYPQKSGLIKRSY